MGIFGVMLALHPDEGRVDIGGDGLLVLGMVLFATGLLTLAITSALDRRAVQPSSHSAPQCPDCLGWGLTGVSATAVPPKICVRCGGLGFIGTAEAGSQGAG